MIALAVCLLNLVVLMSLLADHLTAIIIIMVTAMDTEVEVTMADTTAMDTADTADTADTVDTEDTVDTVDTEITITVTVMDT